MSSETLKLRLATVDEESWMKSSWCHNICRIEICINEIIKLQAPDPAHAPEFILAFYVNGYWKLEKVLALMLGYFEVEVREVLIFCHGYRETYPTAIDELQKNGSPFKNILGKGRVLLFLQRYRMLCHLYKQEYDKDLQQHLDFMLRELQSLLNMGPTWLEVQDALCDIVECIKMDATQRREGMSTWARIRAYNFSLALKKEQSTHMSEQELATPQGLSFISQLKKESSFLQNFGQSPELYIRNISVMREHSVVKEIRMQATITQLKDQIKTLEKEKEDVAKTLEEKETYIRNLPDWVQQVNTKDTAIWEKLDQADRLPLTKESQTSARALIRGFDKHVGLRKRAGGYEGPIKFGFRDRTRFLCFMSLPRPLLPQSSSRNSIKESDLSIISIENAIAGHDKTHEHDKDIKAEDSTTEMDDIVPGSRTYQLGSS